jgi:hypothetical protein
MCQELIKGGHSKMLSTVTPPYIAGNILIIYHSEDFRGKYF